MRASLRAAASSATVTAVLLAGAVTAMPAAASPAAASPAAASPAAASPAAASPAAATPQPAASAAPEPAALDAQTPAVTHEQNPSVPRGAAWTEQYFPSSAPSSNGDEVVLHADVLRPADLADDARTPVIMSIGPYFSHSGMNEDTHPAHTGPSSRFTDLIEEAGLMDRGYTFVYVDLRGFGGSTGCLDWLGPGEQADVVSAVEWAASQPWSTGAVGLYGKSYDGSTGLVGIDLQPEGLKAVVAQEPSWSPYDYLITNDVSRAQQKLSPASYVGIAGLPGVDRSYQQDGYDIPADTTRYLESAAYEKSHPECAESVTSGTEEMSRSSDFWTVRDTPSHESRSTVPFFFTQGLTEQNTIPQSMQLFLSKHAGEQRGWLGPWDHVRGNERDDQGRLQMGRAGWFDEVMDFYDRHLKEQTSEVSSRFVVQDNFGAWRIQDAWGTTAKTAVVPLRSGSYLDSGRGEGGDDPGAPEPTPGPNPNPLLFDDGDPDPAPQPNDQKLGVVSVSQPVRAAVRLTGTPTAELHTEGAGNTAVQLWDVAPDRSAVTINSTVSTLSADGTTRFGLLGMDWTLAAGHRLAVTVDTIDWGPWVAQPSDAEIVVTGGAVSIAVESPAGDVPTEGGRAPNLDDYIEYFTWDSPFPEVDPTFALSATDGRIAAGSATVRAGEQVVIAGTAYDPAAPVSLVLDDRVSTVTTDADGGFSTPVTVPASATPGVVTLTAVAEDGGTSAVELFVLAADASAPAPATSPAPRPGEAALAATGTSGDGVVGVAGGSAALLLLGVGLLLARRRTRPAR